MDDRNCVEQGVEVWFMSCGLISRASVGRIGPAGRCLFFLLDVRRPVVRDARKNKVVDAREWSRPPRLARLPPMPLFPKSWGSEILEGEEEKVPGRQDCQVAEGEGEEEVEGEE